MPHVKITELLAEVDQWTNMGESILASAHPGAAQEPAGSPYCGIGRRH
jgi:hypothetical protein